MLTLYKPAGLTVEVIDVAVDPPQEFPPMMADVPDQQLTVGVAFALGLGGFVARTEGDAVTFEAVGALPPGVVLDALTGELTGTPTTPGSYTVAVAAIDNDGRSNSDAITFVVVAPPPPPLPIDPALGAVVSKTINPAKTLMLPGFMAAPSGWDPGRYERFQQTVIVKGATAQLRATTNNFTAGGSKIQFGAALTLTLTFDGKPVASKAVAATDVNVTFDVDLSNITEGWYKTSVTGLDATWSALDYAVYVMKGDVAQPQTRMPVITGSYTLANYGTPTHHFAWVPAKFDPVILPLVPRECPHFSEVPRRAHLVITQLVHGRFADTYRPCVTKEGVMTTANLQPYFFFDFQQPRSKFPLLDGPRGRGTVMCPTHVEVGKAAPTAKEGNALGPIDNTYFCDPWRAGKVRENGEVVTLAGYRHKSLPHYHADPQTCELVGDWSAIPVERQGFHELWGMAWRIYPTDYTADPIGGGEKNLRPHVSGNEMFLADQRRVMPNGTGRIVKLKFSPTSHSTPPVVTELHGDRWKQCFDVVGRDGVLYASDRMGHRIRVLSMDDGHIIEEWPVTMPEGLYLHERTDGWWLYYTSTIRKSLTNESSEIVDMQIRRRHLVTQQDVLITSKLTNGSMNYYVNNNSLLTKIAVSDGTFGPKGMIALATWSNSYYGYPLFFDGETGALINWLAIAQYSDPPIKGIHSPGMTYTSAPGFGNGRMVWGTACDGLFMASKALPTDAVWSAQAIAGEHDYKGRGFVQTNGHYGMGQYGSPQRWNVSPEIDAFLFAHGHVKAA